MKYAVESTDKYWAWLKAYNSTQLDAAALLYPFGGPFVQLTRDQVQSLHLRLDGAEDRPIMATFTNLQVASALALNLNAYGPDIALSQVVLAFWFLTTWCFY